MISLMSMTKTSVVAGDGPGISDATACRFARYTNVGPELD